MEREKRKKRLFAGSSEKGNAKLRSTVTGSRFAIPSRYRLGISSRYDFFSSSLRFEREEEISPCFFESFVEDRDSGDVGDDDTQIQIRRAWTETVGWLVWWWCCTLGTLGSRRSAPRIMYYTDRYITPVRHVEWLL